METKTITTQELINLIVTHNVQELDEVEKVLVSNISDLNDELQQLNTTLSVLSSCGLSDCAEFTEIENKTKDYIGTIDGRTEMLIKVRQALKTFNERA
ncbi:MAG: hypothetical protein ACI3VR_04445 [Intestinibacter sp.]|uniref:hypothetical protein n=1 Tax=Intestinibacter sp. TaxID=1965304 RepID=UPI003F16C1B9